MIGKDMLPHTASIWAIMPILRVLIVARSLRRGVEEAKDLAVIDAKDLALQCTRRQGHWALSSIPGQKPEGNQIK